MLKIPFKRISLVEFLQLTTVTVVFIVEAHSQSEKVKFVQISSAAQLHENVCLVTIQ